MAPNSVMGIASLNPSYKIGALSDCVSLCRRRHAAKTELDVATLALTREPPPVGEGSGGDPLP